MESKIRKELKKVVNYNERMLEKGKEDQVITFYHEAEGIAVSNPFYDTTERFEVDPLEEYKAKDLLRMISIYKAQKRKSLKQILFK